MWCSNKLCEAAVLQRNHELHAARLNRMRPMIDNRDPRRPKQSNSKGARLLEERNAQIMHENSILLNKLSRILTRDSSDPTAQIPTQGPPLVRGLHNVYRRQVKEQIDRDNQALLRRLQGVKPSIDVSSAEHQWQQHAHLLAANRSYATNPFVSDSFNSGMHGSRKPRPRSANDAISASRRTSSRPRSAHGAPMAPPSGMYGVDGALPTIAQEPIREEDAEDDVSPSPTS